MRISNTTKFKTSDLKKLFYRCVNEVNKIEKPDKKQYKSNYYKLQFKSRHLRVESVGGRARLSGYYMSILIPDHWEVEDVSFERKEKIARTIIHEYYHNLGYMNFDRHHYKYDTSKTWKVDWVKDYTIRLRTDKDIYY